MARYVIDAPTLLHLVDKGLHAGAKAGQSFMDGARINERTMVMLAPASMTE